MEITVDVKNLARPILQQMINYNFDRWAELDGVKNLDPEFYDKKIYYLCTYLGDAIPGITCQTDRDTENGIYGGITINGEYHGINLQALRNAYLKQHPAKDSDKNA